MTQTYTITPISLDQLDACWNLRLTSLREHPEAFGQPYEVAANLSSTQVRDLYDTWWTSGDNQVFIAIDKDGTIVGMTGVVREARPTEGHRAKVWGVYVAPHARSRGIASLLLDATIGWCRSLDGVLQLHLEVAAVNPTATRVYQRAGFVLCGITPRSRIVSGRALDHLQMVLTLDDYRWNPVDSMEGPQS